MSIKIGKENLILRVINQTQKYIDALGSGEIARHFLAWTLGGVVSSTVWPLLPQRVTRGTHCDSGDCAPGRSG
jgi:hypothetical protein